MWASCYKWTLVGALLLLVSANGYQDSTSSLPSADQLPASAGRTLTMSATRSEHAAPPEEVVLSTRTATDVKEAAEVDEEPREKRSILDRAGEQELSRDTSSATTVLGAPRSKRVDENLAAPGEFIQPTRTEEARAPHVEVQTTEADKWIWTGSGEGQGAPRGRQLRLSGPGKNSEPTQLSTHLGNERKTNPDIQDIITGIVKLLNGNAKAPPPPMPLPIIGGGHGRPLRPIMTRINNRGPPRISDIPSSFEGDIPINTSDDIGMMPPPPPRPLPPYPFETPENSHQNPALYDGEVPAIIPLPPQPNQVASPFSGGGGVPLPVQVVPVQDGRPQNGQDGRPNENHPNNQENRPNTQENRPNIQENTPNSQESHPDLIQDVRPVIGPQNRPVLRPRPRPRPQIPNKRRPIQPLKKPESDIVFGNKKKTETQYVTVGQFSQDPSEDASVGVSLTMDNEDTMEEVTFTTDNPPKEEIAEKPVDFGLKVNETRENVTEIQLTTPEPTSSSVVIKPTKSSSIPVLNNTSVENTTTSEVPKVVITMTSSASSVTEATSINATANVEASSVIGQGDASGPGTGQGAAEPIIESSMGQGMTSLQDTTVQPTTSLPQNKAKPQYNTGAYRPRPGIVLDDTEYKPLGSRQTIITAPHRGQVGEVFDVTVSAIQGGAASEPTGKPYIYPVEIEGVKLPGGGHGEVSVITAAEEGQHFVSIDGKRTYINLFGESTETAAVATPPTRVQASKPTAVGAGYVEPAPEPPKSRPPPRPHTRRPPNQPPVRIDTCIVGDDSTCDVQQNERCMTEHGVSSCHCRPSYSRRKHREPCRRVVSIAMSLRVDKMYDRRVTWSNKLESHDSEEYRQLQYEASRALDSAMSMTPFSDEFIGTKVSGMHTGGGKPGTQPTSVYVNVTLQLEENADTSRPTVRHEIQRHLLGVLQRRNNNVGDSALWVDDLEGSISQLQDVDECTSASLHDCHPSAECTNTFGSYRCTCTAGTRDPWLGNAHRQGKHCETCAPEHCNNRGVCRYEAAGQQACTCSSGFYGSQCEIDGEVLGVAIGASVAAVIIIALTLVCLCMWSRRWSREQKTAAGLGSPVFGYMAAGGSTVKTPAMGAPPYQVSLEDRMRWAQIADVMAQANHYAQPEPGTGPTRPSSAVFGYPTLQHMGHMGTMSHAGTMQHSMGTMSHAGTMAPPVPLPRMNIPHNVQTMNRSQAAMSTHGGYSLHGGTFNPHSGLRTPDTKRAFESSSSDEEDRTDLLGRNFHVPRPKSRSSVANQSGIYYDVDTDQADLYSSKLHSIPMSTYTTRSNNYFMQ